MKSFVLSSLIFAISYFGFIVAPMFIVGVRYPLAQQVSLKDEQARAREQIEINKSMPGLTMEELQKLYDIAYPNRKKDPYSAREIYSIGQNNFLWFSWIPVLILFLILSKTKNDLLYFSGIAIFFFVIGVININTLASFVLAAIFGFVFKRLYTFIRSAIVNATTVNDDGVDGL